MLFSEATKIQANSSIEKFKEFPLRSGNANKMACTYQWNNSTSSTYTRKKIQIGKEDVELSLFDDMILYLKILKMPSKNY